MHASEQKNELWYIACTKLRGQPEEVISGLIGQKMNNKYYKVESINERIVTVNLSIHGHIRTISSNATDESMITSAKNSK